jgi:outer membrane protein assembly factor BamB
LKKNRIILFVSLAMGALFLSACGSPVNTWPGLTADAERAYLANGPIVYAIDLQDGDEVWHYPQEPDNKLLFYAPPLLTADGQLLIGSAGTNYALVSLDAQTGRENWASPFTGARDTWVAAPLVVDDLIYAPNTDGNLYVLDLDGSLVDTLELGGALWSQPVSDGNVIYVASLDHHVHVIDPATRAILQTIDLGGAIPGGVTLGTDGVYAGSAASRVEFVGLDGTHHTLAETKDWVWGAPALDGETLYFADVSGNVYSLDLASDRQNWGAVIPDPEGPITPSPLVVGEQIIVVTESGTVFALDRQGQIVWEESLEGKLYTQAVNSGELVLVAPFQGDVLLVALDLTGRQAWTFKPE